MTEQKTAIDDGGAAFPGFQHTDGRGPFKQNQNGEWEAHSHGMSLRAYLAGQALQGHCANPEMADQTSKQIATSSVECADALIAELNGGAA